MDVGPVVGEVLGQEARQVAGANMRGGKIGGGSAASAVAARMRPMMVSRLLIGRTPSSTSSGRAPRAAIAAR